MIGEVRARGLGKAYKRYRRKSGRLAEWLGLGCHHEDVWVLRDATFDVGRGEAVGVVGANGAGKSTLLKLDQRDDPPTAGGSRPEAASPRCWSSAWASIRTSRAGRTSTCAGPARHLTQDDQG